MILFDIIELALGGDIMKLTRADKAAIQNGDSNYLVNKGIRYYYDQDYEVALDYFHLAAALGNGRAAGYIGHCYMHGEGVPVEVDLALSYFRIGMDSRDVESFYRLGKNYCDGVGVEKDHELGVYYYENALAELLENGQLQEQLAYPALFYQLALEKAPGGGMGENLSTSYKYLLIAHTGYTLAIENGAFYYEKDLEEVQEKMNDDMYDGVKEIVEKEFRDEYL